MTSSTALHTFTLNSVHIGPAIRVTVRCLLCDRFSVEEPAMIPAWLTAHNCSKVL